MSILNPNFIHDKIRGREWFHEHISDNKNLLIVIGDSWTWGDSLGNINYQNGIFDDFDHRTKNIYGYHLSNLLNYDWVNIAICGTSNLHILHETYKFIKQIKKEYEKIHVVFTLTESGRELRGKNFLLKRDEFELIKGDNWPTYDNIINKKIDIDSLFLIMLKENFEISYDIFLYYYIVHSASLTEFLENYERATFLIIKKIFKELNVEYTIARNFTETFDVNKNILGNSLITKKWVDVISECGNLEKYPLDVRVVSQIGIDPIINYLKSYQYTKSEFIDYFTSADMAITWLNNSKYNAKIATKHPLEQAHYWWAEYLYKCISSKKI
jgi:hypothetical protein